MTQAKTRIVVVCPIRIFPMTGGGSARVLAYVDYLREAGFEVHLVTVPHNSRGRAQLDDRADRIWIPDEKRLVRQDHTSSADSAGTSSPMFSNWLHRGLMKMRHQIPWLEGLLDQPNGYSSIELNRNPRFDQFAREVIHLERPKAVITLFAWTARILEGLPEHTLKIIDTIDVQYLRAQTARQAGYDLQRTFCTAEEEAAELRRADILMAIQAEEQQHLKALCSDRKVVLAEHAHTFEGSPFYSAPSARNLLFVGNLYEPNVDGINAFIKQAWPKVLAEVPNATLTVCGQVCRKTRKAQGVVLAGVVDDLRAYYQEAAIVINPVPYGTGLKIKTVEALGYGKCLVTTPSGMTGLPLDNGAQAVVEDMAGMARAVTKLLKDARARREMEDKAASFARERFAPETTYEELAAVLRQEVKQ